MSFSPYLSHHAKEIKIPPVNQVSAHDRGLIPSRGHLKPNGSASYAVKNIVPMAVPVNERHREFTNVAIESSRIRKRDDQQSPGPLMI